MECESKTPMTKQEIFTKVAAHLLRQNAQAMVCHNGAFTCMYRAEAGLKCAIGCLISDEEYTPELEGKSVQMLLDEGKLPQLITEETVTFLNTLQAIHDGYPPDEWQAKLSAFADDWKLSKEGLPL